MDKNTQKLHKEITTSLDELNHYIQVLLQCFSETLKFNQKNLIFINTIFKFFTSHLHKDTKKFIKKNPSMMIEIGKTFNDDFVDHCKTLQCFHPMENIKSSMLKKFLKDQFDEIIKYINMMHKIKDTKLHSSMQSNVLICMCLSMLLFIKIKLYYPSIKFKDVHFAEHFNPSKHISVNAPDKENYDIHHVLSAGLFDGYLDRTFVKSKVHTGYSGRQSIDKTKFEDLTDSDEEDEDFAGTKFSDKTKKMSFDKSENDDMDIEDTDIEPQNKTELKKNIQNESDQQYPALMDKPKSLSKSKRVLKTKNINSSNKSDQKYPALMDKPKSLSKSKSINKKKSQLKELSSFEKAKTFEELNLQAHSSQHAYTNKNPTLTTIYKNLERLMFYIDQFIDVIDLKNREDERIDFNHYVEHEFKMSLTSGFETIMNDIGLSRQKFTELSQTYIKDSLFRVLKNKGLKLFKKIKDQELNTIFQQIKNILLEKIPKRVTLDDDSNRLFDLIVFFSMLIQKQKIQANKQNYDLEFIASAFRGVFMSHLHCAKNRLIKIIDSTIIPGIINLETSEVLKRSFVKLKQETSVDNNYNCEYSVAVLSKETKDVNQKQNLIEINSSNDSDSFEIVDDLYDTIESLSDNIRALIGSIKRYHKNKSNQLKKIHECILEQFSKKINSFIDKQNIKALDGEFILKLIEPFMKPLDEFDDVADSFNSIKNQSIMTLLELMKTHIVETIETLLKEQIDIQKHENWINLISILSIILYYKLRSYSPQMAIIFNTSGEEYEPYYHEPQEDDESDQIIKRMMVPGVVDKNTRSVLLKIRVELEN